jgi:hypothetical protein
MAIQKDYKAIAEIINHEYIRFDNTGENDFEGKHAITIIAYNMAGYFASKNKWFNRDTFINECGVAD